MYSSFYRRTFLIVTLIVLGWALWSILEPLWSTLGWAIVLAFLLNPLHERLTAKFKGRASLSAGILTGLTPFFVIAPIVFLGVAFARQVASILSAMSKTTLTYPALLQRLDTIPVIGSAVRWMRDSAPVSAEQVQGWVMEGAQTLLKSAASVSGSLALGIMGSLVGFFMMLFLLFSCCAMAAPCSSGSSDSFRWSRGRAASCWPTLAMSRGLLYSVRWRRR